MLVCTVTVCEPVKMEGLCVKMSVALELLMEPAVLRQPVH